MASKVYIVKITAHNEQAKNKGCIGAGKDSLVIRATDADDAYRQACSRWHPDDKRPLAGKSYLRGYVLQVGRQVRIERGYVTSYASNGRPNRSYVGTISEVLGDEHFSVKFPDYHTDYVDFHVSELA